ncbi:hypothetical protein DL767_006050 [Monosporascus sp. MG133]|nr:hypothetical protein DL767_006050 [Monosporascus sp. MG133]
MRVAPSPLPHLIGLPPDLGEEMVTGVNALVADRRIHLPHIPIRHATLSEELRGGDLERDPHAAAQRPTPIFRHGLFTNWLARRNPPISGG